MVDHGFRLHDEKKNSSFRDIASIDLKLNEVSLDNFVDVHLCYVLNKYCNNQFYVFLVTDHTNYFKV